ncbi:MAG: S8 family serine peptidase [Halobacteriales archaeon]|nr:S8 family serine peptidase [Halobacteriales archaeon]
MSIKHDRKRARTRTEVALIFVGVVALFITFAGGVVAAQDDVGGVSIGEELKDGFESDRSVDVILRMGKVDVRTPPGLRRAEARANAVEQMKRGAEKRQEPVIDRLEDMEGVDVRSSFWMGNAVRVDVDTSRVSLDELKSLPGVIRIHENHRVEALSVAPSSDIDAGQLEPMSHTTESYSWALEQINVPDIQREFGSLLAEDDTQVAVLDTGIDPNHPDLTVNGWAEFDDNGTKVNSNPNDCDVHGTHVSGTVAGNGSIDEDDYGLYGVAPDTVELYHGGVLTEESTGGCGTGSFASILAGMEWAANETDSDIISMSLGASGTHADYIQPVQQAQNAGSAVVASIGNDGVGTSGSPGNVYDSISVGASTKGGYIANFSGGEVIDTDSAWNNPPEDWPDSYTVPSVSAPGRGIYSSVNDGDYEGLQGTSMAAPHVSGAAALIMSVDPNDDMTPNELEGLLRNTSRKPDVTGLDAEFSVGIDDINSPLNEGDVLQVDYSLTVSNEAETGLVVLQILDENGNIVQEIADTTYRTIEPGDTATGTLSWNTTGQTDGTYIAGVGVINATGEIDDTATNTFDIGSGSTTSIAAADGDTTDLTFSIAQTDTDTRYGTGIIDPYAAIVEEFVDGNVSGTNIQEGTYETGDVVNATVTLNNTGDIQNEFFVHHEVQGPDGVWRDNAGNTGKSVQLSPDSSPEQVDVSWEVEDNAPEGTYNSSITVWAEQDYEHREHDIQQLDETDTFEVDNTTSDTNLRVKDVEAQEPVVEGEELNVVVDVENQGVNVTDNQNVLLNVRVNETLNLEDVDSESVSVNPDDNETVTLTYTTKEGDSGENSRISVEAVTEDDTEGENDTAGIIALDFWNEVTESDGDLSLFDAGTAIQEFHDDGQVNGITFTLRDVNLPPRCTTRK